MLNLLSSNYAKSALKKKDYQRSTAQSLHKHSQSTLGNGDISQAVRLPKNEQLNEWLAVHVVDFYNCILLIYDQVNACMYIYSFLFLLYSTHTSSLVVVMMICLVQCEKCSLTLLFVYCVIRCVSVVRVCWVRH